MEKLFFSFKCNWYNTVNIFFLTLVFFGHRRLVKYFVIRKKVTDVNLMVAKKRKEKKLVIVSGHIITVKVAKNEHVCRRVHVQINSPKG